MSRPTFGHWLWDERQARSLSRRALADLIRTAAERDGEPNCRCDEKAVRRWENHQTRPKPDYVRWIAAALDKPVAEVSALVRPGLDHSDRSGPSLAVLGPVEPADADYIEGIRLTIQRVVGIAAIHGANEVALAAARAYRSAQRKLLAGGHPQHLTRDLQAATGEMAEVAGWLAHDAGQQETARALNIEALYWLRLAGDRSIELLTLSNMAWMAIFRKEPNEALMLAQNQLGTPLSNRQRVMFQLREARALAQLGRGTEATGIAETAQNGLGGNDPTWNWWADESEVLDHVAATHAEAGDSSRAVELLEHQDYRFPVERMNRRYNALAWRLGISVAAGAYSDAENLIGRILPFLSEVRSGRTEAMLSGTVRQIRALPVSSTLRDAGQQLSEILSFAQE